MSSREELEKAIQALKAIRDTVTEADLRPDFKPGDRQGAWYALMLEEGFAAWECVDVNPLTFWFDCFMYQRFAISPKGIKKV